MERVALAEDEQPLVGEELQAVRELRRQPELHRRGRVVRDVRHERAQRGDGLGADGGDARAGPELQQEVAAIGLRTTRGFAA